MKKILESSYLIGIMNKLRFVFIFSEKTLDDSYQKSMLHSMALGLCKTTKIYFRYSFFARINDIVPGRFVHILKGSKSFKMLYGSCARGVCKISAYLNIWVIKSSVAGLKKFQYLAFKTVVKWVSAGILASILFSFLMRKDIKPSDWLIRIAIIAAGCFIAYLCIKWESVRKTSYFSRFLDNSCKMKK